MKEQHDEGLNLFEAAAESGMADGGLHRFEPLAQRMRPRTFEEFVGQQEAVGAGRFLRRMMEQDQVPSMILYGPPGTGKTTLAQMIAGLTHSAFRKLNAVASGIADIRAIVKEAEEQRRYHQRRTIVFIDEIHRFNKSQQDVLLPYVEDGRLVLIGATTENPFFEVNHALLSRVRVVRLYKLTDGQLVKILQQALADEERGLGGQHLTAADGVLAAIAQFAGGDARMALNILEEMAAMLPPSGGKLTQDLMESIVGERVQSYDKKGDNHYDTASAFIKKKSVADTTRLFTNQMLGDSLKGKLNGEWEFTDGFYPRLKGDRTKEVAYVASAPLIFRDTTENVYTISDSFDLSLLEGTEWHSRVPSP